MQAYTRLHDTSLEIKLHEVTRYAPLMYTYRFLYLFFLFTLFRFFFLHRKKGLTAYVGTPCGEVEQSREKMCAYVLPCI